MDINELLKESRRIEPLLPEFDGGLTPLMSKVKFVAKNDSREVSRILFDAENLLTGSREIADFRESGIEIVGFDAALSDLIRLFHDIQRRCATHFEGRVQQIKAHASVSAMRAAPSEGGVLDITKEYRLINAYPDKKENDVVKKVVETGFSSDIETGTVSGNVCYFLATAQDNTAPAGSVVLPPGMSFELKKGDVINLHTYGLSSKEGLIEEKGNKTVIMQAVDETVKVTGPAVWSPSALSVDLTSLLERKESFKKAEQYSSSLKDVPLLAPIFSGFFGLLSFVLAVNSSNPKDDILINAYWLFSASMFLALIFDFCSRSDKKENLKKAKKILNEVKITFDKNEITNNDDLSLQERECLDSIKETETLIREVLDEKKACFDNNKINMFPVVPLLHVLPARFALSAGGKALRVMEQLLAIEDKRNLDREQSENSIRKERAA